MAVLPLARETADRWWSSKDTIRRRKEQTTQQADFLSFLSTFWIFVRLLVFSSGVGRCDPLSSGSLIVKALHVNYPLDSFSGFVKALLSLTHKHTHTILQLIQLHSEVDQVWEMKWPSEVIWQGFQRLREVWNMFFGLFPALYQVFTWHFFLYL